MLCKQKTKRMLTLLYSIFFYGMIISFFSSLDHNQIKTFRVKLLESTVK